MLRDYLFGLTSKNVAATSIMAAVVALTSALTGATLQRISDSLARHASTEQDQMMNAVRLVQQAESLTGLGMALALADSHEARRSMRLELQDRAEWMDKLGRELSGAGLEPELLDQVAKRQNELGDNIVRLDSEVGRRIDGDRSAVLAERIGWLAAQHREIAGELGVLMGYFSTLVRDQLGEESARLAREASEQQRRLLLQTGVLLLFVVLSGLYVECVLVRRIQRLRRAVTSERVDPAQLELSGRDELAQLGRTVAHYVRCIQADEAQLQQLNGELSFLAWHDPLTQLANRRQYDSAATGLLLHSRLPLCVALGDIDHFKHINDTHGHAVGDQALVHIARQIQAGLRADDLVARVGGEEFALVLPVRDAQEAGELLERVRQRIADCPLQLDGQPLALTISWGYTLLDGLSPPADSAGCQKLLETALHAADNALYQAKHGGRNQVRCVAPPARPEP